MDVVVASEELAAPLNQTGAGHKGFSLYMLRAIRPAAAMKVIELAKTNWLR